MHEIVWELEIQDKDHVLKMRMGTTWGSGTGAGKLLVDEKEVSCWGPSSSWFPILKLLISWLVGGGIPYYVGVPVHQSLDIEGKKVEIKRKWKGLAGQYCISKVKG